MKDYSKISDNELQAQLTELEAKYQKMRALALKIGGEMDSLSEQFILIKQELSKRN